VNKLPLLTISGLVVYLLATEFVTNTWAQYAPDPGLTRSFAEDVGRFQKSKTSVFASICTQAHDQVAVMLLPVGSLTGKLTLFISGEAYNMSGVRIEDGRPVVYEALGGNWSYDKMQNLANQLATNGFKLMSPRDLNAILVDHIKQVCTDRDR